MSAVAYRFRHAAAGRQEKIPVPAGYSIAVADLDCHIKDSKLASPGLRRLAESVFLFYDADTGEEYGGDGVQIPSGAKVVVRLLTMWSAAFQGSKRAAEFRRVAAEAKSRRDEKAANLAASLSSSARAVATPKSQQRSRSYWCFLKTTPGYVCRRCGVPGHYIQACPTNGDSCYDDVHMRGGGRAGGGSRSSQDEQKAVASWNGVFCSVAPSSSKSSQFPAELLCPLCKGVMRDAVLTRCCFQSFCDESIRARMISTLACECGAIPAAASADGLVPNRTLRETIAPTLAASKSSGSSTESGCDRSIVTEEDTRGRGSSWEAAHHDQPLGKKRAAERRPPAGGFYSCAAEALHPPKKLKS